MIERSSGWLAMLLVLGITVLAAWSVANPTRPFHPNNTQCNACHVATDVTVENASQLIASQEKLCTSCHAKAVLASHPTGFAPNRSLPEGLPLDWKGDVTCSTCHQIHSGEAGLLRGEPAGKQFCLQCHQREFFDRMADGGLSIQHSGHLSASVNVADLALDTFSRQCLACHLESGDGPTVILDSRGIVRHGTGSANHPIGMDYRSAMRSGLYREPRQLPPAILLPEGKVGCVSCHVGYSKEHGALVARNERSSLCLTCHDM